MFLIKHIEIPLNVNHLSKALGNLQIPFNYLKVI